MRSELPKVLHPVLGVPLVEHVVRAARQAGVERVVLVVSPDHQAPMEAALGHLKVTLAVQAEPKGTAHAVLAAREALGDFNGTGIVLVGDAPCLRPQSLAQLVSEHRERAAAVSVLTGEVAEPRGYGRIVRGLDGDVAAIVEEKDGTATQRAIREINSGIFALELPRLFDVLAKVSPSAATGELYLTDVVELIRSAQGRVHAVCAAEAEEVQGVNDRVQLAQITAALRQRINLEHMRNGVTIVDPATTFIDARAVLEPDVRIEPFVVVEGACHIERGAVLGPFARVRGDSRVGENARVGNFVELARSSLGPEVCALHHTYVGDGVVGRGANLGAGTIFANWDGQEHHTSTVGEGVQVGASTVLVGPSSLGAGARTGAGAVVARSDVPAGETWVGVPARPIQARKGGDR
jgi:bifunctional UDP-N-acetylglucosamine pyrophosphorylase / glucosamine-1-phosphate N-acetyltransferase